MIIKLCYNSEIHRVSQQPATFKALNDAVKNVFGKALPPVYALQYTDVDGDRVMISNEEDYNAMLETAMPNSSKSIKIYVVSLDESVITLQLLVMNLERRLRVLFYLIFAFLFRRRPTLIFSY